MDSIYVLFVLRRRSFNRSTAYLIFLILLRSLLELGLLSRTSTIVMNSNLVTKLGVDIFLRRALTI